MEHYYTRCWTRCCAFYHQRSNLSCNKSGCGKLREYWRLIGQNYAVVRSYTGLSSLAAKYVCLAGKTRNIQRFCCKKLNYSLLSLTTFFATCNNLIVARQVELVLQQCYKTRFWCPFFRTLTLDAHAKILSYQATFRRRAGELFY